MSFPLINIVVSTSMCPELFLTNLCQRNGAKAPQMLQIKIKIKLHYPVKLKWLQNFGLHLLCHER